ncbi:MAG: transcriptional antiterminator NusG [Verrucomicrobiales bacterium]|jgi:transcriptional antiterminator NusG
MPLVPSPEDQWYVVHVLSGKEGRVRDSLKRRIESEEMGDRVFEVLVPMERVSEVKRGKKTETNRKFFPGYIIINMHMLNEDNSLVDETWYFIQETPDVINFAGSKNIPMPMRPREVQAMLAQIRDREDHAVPKVLFGVGDTVKVKDGPFDGQNGVVEEIDLEKGKLRVSVDLFGRATPVDLEFWQVETE